MPAGKNPGPSVKDDDKYDDWTEELRGRLRAVGVEARASMSIVEAISNSSS